MNSRRGLSRRAFVHSATATGFAAHLLPSLPVYGQTKVLEAAYPENGELIPDEGWQLWVDDKASWSNDDIFLPDDVHQNDKGEVLGKGSPLPVNPPTGGWDLLTSTVGKPVVLPSTVEQHFWGKFGVRPYRPEEYRYAAPGHDVTAPADDNVPQNGAYFGVSWWYRNIDIPSSMKGKRIFLHVRGAHLRAEVYLNRKLVGYSVMEELPFEAELTHAAKPGEENVLAIRITNPFGRFDWVDGLNAKWGKVSLYRSHGFGGLDRGMTISAHDATRIKDAWVLNTPETGKVTAYVQLEGEDIATAARELSFDIVDPLTGRILERQDSGAPRGIVDDHGTIQAGKRPEGDKKTLTVCFDLTCRDAAIWDLDHPVLYHLKIRTGTDVRSVAFGFRWFAPEGLGKNALFRLNGRRIRIYTAISWGFWGLNGMFPVPELAEKEVTQAKVLGLNCLNFHRNLAKEDVLRAHDRLGLLRYMEPGAGKMAIGKLPKGVQANAAGTVMEKPANEADLFAQRYMFVKCVEMVKAHRSHPCLIEYCLQNEIGADLKNPATLDVLAAMRAEDPSRCIVLNDGFVARGAAQAWYEPYNLKLHRSDEEKAGAWWNNHQGAGDQWFDKFYKSPTDFTYRAPYKDTLTEFGEMEGCARPDVHGLMIHQITDTYKKYGGDSYDLTDHEEIVAGYNRFLDKWKFRQAFPTPDHVFLAVGRTCYESWMNYIENARISDELDFAAISGWESTAIENHSGIVDNLRNFKSDPQLIAGSLLPVRPIAKQHTLSVALGTSATFDLFLANDTTNATTGTLDFSMVTPSGELKKLLTLPTPAHVTDQFSYLLKAGFETPHLVEEGLYRFRFSLSSEPLATQIKEIWVANIESKIARQLRIGVSGIAPALRRQLQNLDGTTVSTFKVGQVFDVVISAGLKAGEIADENVGETTGESLPTAKGIANKAAAPTPGELESGIIEALRSGIPLLVIPQTDALSDGVAKQLAAAGAFTYHGAVGDFRAPWMGNWYVARQHALFEGMPVNQALGGFYQAEGRPSNGLLIDQAPGGGAIDVVVAYSRDHDRNIGAGTFTATLGQGKLVYHRVPDFHPVMQQRFINNVLRWLSS
jgi:beta-galactosidase